MFPTVVFSPNWDSFTQSTTSGEWNWLQNISSELDVSIHGANWFYYFSEGATSQWPTESSAAKQRGITLSGMTLWQTQCPWWTQCPPLSLSPLSSVPPSRSCWTAHRHGDIATERLRSEKNHAFIFIPVPIFKYPVNWPIIMALGAAGWSKQCFPDPLRQFWSVGS